MNEQMLEELKQKGLTNLAELLSEKVKKDEEDEPELDDEEKEKKSEVAEEKVCKESAIETFAKTLELSEEQVASLKDIFDAAVNERVLAKATELEESVKEHFVALEEAQDKHITNYLDFVVEGWVAKNEVELVSAAKVELAESFLTQLKSLFTENEIVLESNDKFDLVAVAQAEVATVKAELAEAVDMLAESKQEIFGGKVLAVITKLTEGMVETDKERFVALAADLEVTMVEGIDAVETRLLNLKEAFVKAPVETTEVQESETVLDDALVIEETVEEVAVPEEIKESVEKPLDEKMAAYVKAIKKSSSARTR